MFIIFLLSNLISWAEPVACGPEDPQKKLIETMREVAEKCCDILPRFKDTPRKHEIKMEKENWSGSFAGVVLMDLGAFFKEGQRILDEQNTEKNGCPDGCLRVNAAEMQMNIDPLAPPARADLEECNNKDLVMSEEDVKASGLTRSSWKKNAMETKIKCTGQECAGALKSWIVNTGMKFKDKIETECPKSKDCRTAMLGRVIRSTPDTGQATVAIHIKCLPPPKGNRNVALTGYVENKWRCEKK
jgi:hypothetical protein